MAEKNTLRAFWPSLQITVLRKSYDIIMHIQNLELKGLSCVSLWMTLEQMLKFSAAAYLCSDLHSMTSVKLHMVL